MQTMILRLKELENLRIQKQIHLSKKSENIPTKPFQEPEKPETNLLHQEFIWHIKESYFETLEIIRKIIYDFEIDLSNEEFENLLKKYAHARNSLHTYFL